MNPVVLRDKGYRVVAFNNDGIWTDESDAVSSLIVPSVTLSETELNEIFNNTEFLLFGTRTYPNYSYISDFYAHFINGSGVYIFYTDAYGRFPSSLSPSEAPISLSSINGKLGVSIKNEAFGEFDVNGGYAVTLVTKTAIYN